VYIIKSVSMLSRNKAKPVEPAENRRAISATSDGTAPYANKHQQKTEETRRKLLQSARRIFARDGFEAARIEDIAAHAGYTRGAFYAHFKLKEDLFFALLEEHLADKIHRLKRELQRSSSVQEKLRILREYYVGRVADKQLSVLLLEFKLFAIRRPRMKPRLLAAHERIRSSIRLDELDDLLPPKWKANDSEDNVKRRSLEGILHGLMLEHVYDPKTLSEEQAAAMLGRIFDTVVEPGNC
jgi:AcrR family transcriptional regulator